MINHPSFLTFPLRGNVLFSSIIPRMFPFEVMPSVVTVILIPVWPVVYGPAGLTMIEIEAPPEEIVWQPMPHWPGLPGLPRSA